MSCFCFSFAWTSAIFDWCPLQAFAQVLGINVYYGPDTYMGANLAVMLRAVAQMSDEEIRALHPEHNRCEFPRHV